LKAFGGAFIQLIEVKECPNQRNARIRRAIVMPKMAKNIAALTVKARRERLTLNASAAMRLANPSLSDCK
jgi:hypothetical protein